jgi:hypothetical protein
VIDPLAAERAMIWGCAPNIEQRDRGTPLNSSGPHYE